MELRLSKVSSEFNFDIREVEAYAATILDYEDQSLDFVVVDGHFRVACLRVAWTKLKSGGLLIFDNSDLPEYEEFMQALQVCKPKVFNNGVSETTLVTVPDGGLPKDLLAYLPKSY